MSTSRLWDSPSLSNESVANSIRLFRSSERFTTLTSPTFRTPLPPYQNQRILQHSPHQYGVTSSQSQWTISLGNRKNESINRSLYRVVMFTTFPDLSCHPFFILPLKDCSLLLLPSLPLPVLPVLHQEFESSLSRRFRLSIGNRESSQFLRLELSVLA